MKLLAISAFPKLFGCSPPLLPYLVFLTAERCLDLSMVGWSIMSISFCWQKVFIFEFVCRMSLFLFLCWSFLSIINEMAILVSFPVYLIIFVTLLSSATVSTLAVKSFAPEWIITVSGFLRIAILTRSFISYDVAPPYEWILKLFFPLIYLD